MVLQTEILKYLQKKGTQKKEELVVRFFDWYPYCDTKSTGKHLGEILATMVKQGILEKPKRGYYQLNENYRPGISGKKKEETNPNQGLLF